MAHVLLPDIEYEAGLSDATADLSTSWCHVQLHDQCLEISPDSATPGLDGKSLSPRYGMRGRAF